MAFTKGQSGNPAGRKPGTRNRATQAVEELLDGEAEALTRKAVELALAGDTVALRLCLDRVAPARKGRPILLPVGDIATLNDLANVQAAIVGVMARGEITPDEAADAVGVIERLGHAQRVAAECAHCVGRQTRPGRAVRAADAKGGSRCCCRD